MKSRLVLFNPIGGIGGAERILLSIASQIRTLDLPIAVSAVLLGDGALATGLAALGVDVRVLPLPSAAAAFGDTQLRGRGKLASLAALVHSGLLTAPDLLRFARRVRAEFNSLRPDLIHSNGLKAHVLSAFAAPRNVPLLWHVQDYYSHRPLVARLLRQLAHGVRQVIACSKDVERDVAAVLPGVPTAMIFNRVDTERFQPEPRDGVKLDELAGLPTAAPGTLRVGLVATYANWKGHDVFLDAIARLTGDVNARFYIVGGPIYSTVGSQFTRAELEERARKLGIFERLGFVPFQADTAAVYRSLDVMVHASTRPEPFGLTIAEAMACGTATIVADAGGARELFTEGVDAIGHRPGDAASLATAMIALLTDDARRAALASHSRQTVLERFSEASLGRDLIRLYSQYVSMTPR